MLSLRRAATKATDFACRFIGRNHMVRVARFVLWRARLDVPNDFETNGESRLQRWVLDLVPPGNPIHVLDVGANVGLWSDAMVSASQCVGRENDLNIHAFEPSAWTFECLSLTLQGRGVLLHRLALGDVTGTSLLHIIAPGAGTNSLHAPPSATAGWPTEEISTTTLDAFADQAGLEHVALVKIDTEGHDLAVLRGAQELLAERRISVVQFEYNHRWIYGRYYLRDAFQLLGPLNYRIGKLTPFGIEFYPHWDIELETFVEGNYVACCDAVADRLPSVVWWKRVTE